ncbi:MAG: transcriptional regulator BetI [Pseudomonadota bacterium]
MEQVRKAALIEATIAEIGSRGTINVTVNQIAGRAGVSSALAHHYFGGKEDLLLEAMRHTLRLYGKEALRFLKQARTPRERVEGIIRAGFSPANFQRETISAWLNFYVLAQTNTGAHALWSLYQKRLRSNLIYGLKPMIGDRAYDAAARIAGLIDGLYLQEALAARPTGPEIAARHVLTALSQELGALND